MIKIKTEINKFERVTQIKIDIPFPTRFVSIYLLQTEDNKNILIDAGLHFADWTRRFFRVIKEELNMTAKDIDYCVITHEHIDHIGLITKLRRRNPNIQVFMHEVSHDILHWYKDRDNDKEIEKSAREIADGMVKYGLNEHQGDRVVQFFTMWPKMTKYGKPDKLLNDGDVLSLGGNKLKVIWTPGHALGHTCYFDENSSYLFSGDHILSRITPHIGVYTMGPKLKDKYNFDNILEIYLQSLDIIAKLKPKKIFPAHQEVIDNPHERIMEIKKHHQNRLDEISNIIKNNPMTPYEVSLKHFGEDLDELNQYLALSEILSHIIYLEHNDRVERIEKKGKFYFKSLKK